MPAARVPSPHELDEELDGALEPLSEPEAPEASGWEAPPPSPVPVMTGTHFHSLDDKGRVIIPAKLRAALTEQFWMILDDGDNIGLYSYATGMDILEHCERMMAEEPENEEIASAVLRITEATELVIVENGFRVLVPEILRYRATLDKDVVTVGALNHAVLMSREKWEESEASREDSPQVRKTQASLLRAAASGTRRKAAEREAARSASQAEPALERDAPERAERVAEHDGARGAGRGDRVAERAAASGRKAASSGDGGRGSRLLTLSQLGR